MSAEKQMDEIVQAFTTDGGADGIITVSSTRLFKVKCLVVISADTLPDLELQVKRVLNKTQLAVGKPGAIRQRSDVSAYTVNFNAKIDQFSEQPRPQINIDDQNTATYEQEPTLARRMYSVDYLGRGYDIDNPFPVQIADGDITIGQVNVDISDKESAPGKGDWDIIRIGNGVNQLDINPDGSINTIEVKAPQNVINIFNVASTVATGVTTDILTYIVPASGVITLFRIEVSGDNIAQYDIFINDQIQARKRTFWGSSLNAVIDFNDGDVGLKLENEDVVKVKVTHNRPFVGNFEARLQATLQATP